MSFLCNSKTCQQREEQKDAAKEKKCCFICDMYLDSLRIHAYTKHKNTQKKRTWESKNTHLFIYEMAWLHMTALPATAISWPVSSNGKNIRSTHYRFSFFMELNESLKCNWNLPLIRYLVLADSSGSQTSQCDVVHQMDSIERIHCHKYCRTVTNTVWLIQVSTMIQQQLY